MKAYSTKNGEWKDDRDKSTTSEFSRRPQKKAVRQAIKKILKTIKEKDDE